MVWAATAPIKTSCSRVVVRGADLLARGRASQMFYINIFTKELTEKSYLTFNLRFSMVWAAATPIITNCSRAFVHGADPSARSLAGQIS